ncbi:cytochrome c-type biogenesis protein CcmH [Psychrosphaera ytuae]|uniref:Cytochrome c-type biogenesis protein n=2 Tax=Psychrosphaera ytuae TaxID=2820710 RepID=A0A975DEP2_9GAMM|nr:cytochrome c-type biogenesis protein CcmH [Psychrosphaera ytuae]
MTIKSLSVGLLCLSSIAVSPSAFSQPTNEATEQLEAKQESKQESKDITPFKDDAQKSMYLELVTELRCPKCQNQNIADSNAVIAQDMRVKTKELLDEGYSKQDVIDYMVNRYGQFAHYQPPLTLATSILWFLPVAFILFCVVLLIQKSQKRIAKQSDADVANTANPAQAAIDEAELDKELNALLDDSSDSNQSNTTSKNKTEGN